MFGFLFGTLCLVGLVGVARGPRACGGGRRWGHPGFGHPGFGHPGYGPRQERFREGAGKAAAEVLKRKLRIDDDQEGIVDHAVSDLRASVRTFVNDLDEGRAELAAAFRGENVDEAALDALFARWDEDLHRTRREVVSAMKQVHAVLDDEQRARAVELLAKAPRAGWVV